jgi:uncharacterized membrane protein (UPF0127 family)
VDDDWSYDEFGDRVDLPRTRAHLRVIALVVAAALVLPFAVGTIVIVHRAITEKAPEREDLPVVAGFGRVGFTIGNSSTVRCALLAETESAQEEGMQGMRNLQGYDAMVFAFTSDATTQFINHFVPIDLSIGWYDATGLLVDHTTMDACPTGNHCPTYASKDPYRYAIETPIGGLEGMGLAHAGSIVHLGGGCT